MAGKAAAGGGAGRDLEMQLRLRTVDEIMQVVVHFIVLFLVHISMLASTRHARASRSKLPSRPNGNSSGHSMRLSFPTLHNPTSICSPAVLQPSAAPRKCPNLFFFSLLMRLSRKALKAARAAAKAAEEEAKRLLLMQQV